MTRHAGHWAAFILLFLGLLLTLAWAQANGFVSERVTVLWSKAIMQIDGPVGFNSTDAFFPPLPYVLSIVLQWIIGSVSVPTPFLLSAGLGAMMVMMWYSNLRYTADVSAITSVLAVALLVLNPFFLRALAEGPEAILTLIGTWIFARGIVNLRLAGNAPDMMKVAVGLLVVSLSNSYGLLICLGALPFMIVAARPSMLVSSPIGYLIAMFYPVAAAIFSLWFISMIFDSSLMPLLTEEPVSISFTTHLIILAGLAPLTFIATMRNVYTPYYFMPLLAAFGTVFGAYWLNNMFHMESDPSLAIAPMLAILVAAIRFWPPLNLREPIILVLLALSLVLSLFSLRANPEAETREWVAAVQGVPLDEYKATQDVARFLDGKDGILVDVERNPEIVPQIDDIQRLIVAGQTVYDWALEGGLLRAKYILVQNTPTDVLVTDRILRRFPELATDQMAFYDEVFANDLWRVFERNEPREGLK
ncbi:hypothetical protein FHS72_001470 [Loktanella ponticola]|uniref:Glycosyltransferase RgtA/B/C/D-like domain-containing protein n=1 Tax=Yoonia ponticola TaxID=1524255 RepID=A0A7W9BJT2_9RHOB|nr:hypothetical protein [Yoonia ponticola]MBB5721858.1 hypothetical protein [Yoonia ponticola]